MNKIVIDKNIFSDSDKVEVNDNKITFNESGIYEIVYQDSQDRELEFIIDSQDIVLLESSFDNDITNIRLSLVV